MVLLASYLRRLIEGACLIDRYVKRLERIINLSNMLPGGNFSSAVGINSDKSTSTTGISSSGSDYDADFLS